MRYTHGVVRADGSLSEKVFEEWLPSKPEIRYTSDRVALATERDACHSAGEAADAENESVRCWLLGDVYGYEDGGHGCPRGYEPRPADIDPAQYCLSLYERTGFEFLEGLNGNYTLLLYDRERQRFALCTDRFGTVPVYWTRADDGSIVFSTNVQLLPFHPAVDTAYHPAYLHEYLAFRCTFGVKTPLEGVEKLEPGTITSIALGDGSLRTEQYWRPQYRPRDESFEWFVEEFADRFRTVVDEWTHDGHEYGVLLSGGSDSRLVLSVLENATAFHMNDWMNREARIAERVALQAGATFELLERGPEYRIGSLERNRWAESFNGWFSQPYTSGFESRITEQVDGLLSGLYSDSLFGGYSVPSPNVSLGPLGSMTVPIERPIETVDEYIDLLLERAHDNLDMPTDLRTVLESNIHRDGDRIVHHGVTYESLEDLVYYGSCYPLSNDDDMRFHTDLRRMLPYRSPFLDNRLLDLSLSMPPRYRLRRDLVGQAVTRLDPDLAAIPHASTGVSLSRSFPVEYAGEHFLEFWRKHVTNRTPPKPYLTDGPWLDDAELLRSFEFTNDVLDQRGHLADAFPGPDADAIRELYHTHCHDEDRVGELYTLLTVLTMPVTEYLTDVPESNRAETIDLLSRQSQVIDVE
ncbi:asparagine synthase-related protein [Natronococcus occultus]|uniref:Asparagine synthase (Glutamine-hydrolyzing) n=1 Tax=Natronococcus occultus SP4 TaxID=694430 RepID=L0JV89_9EURY|nr:asparagine synthase-related protein [Natronococcus occultus]AGB36205.1 asparagine synthase (glutamine-hydrolyzing) [Natronococcus occultus SP4]